MVKKRKNADTHDRAGSGAPETGTLDAGKRGHAAAGTSDPPELKSLDARVGELLRSDLWDDATGDQIKTCKEDAQYCPDKKTLTNMKTISIWAKITKLLVRDDEPFTRSSEYI